MCFSVTKCDADLKVVLAAAWGKAGLDMHPSHIQYIDMLQDKREFVQCIELAAYTSQLETRISSKHAFLKSACNGKQLLNS